MPPPFTPSPVRETHRRDRRWQAVDKFMPLQRCVFALSGRGLPFALLPGHNRWVSAHRQKPTYARAREEELAPGSVQGLLGMSAVEMLGCARTLKRAVNRSAWRRMVAVRTAAISKAARAAERALGDKFFDRQKEPCAWVLRARVGETLVPAIRVVWTPLRRFDEARPPVEVVLLRDDFVDSKALGAVLEATPRRRRRT